MHEANAGKIRTANVNSALRMRRIRAFPPKTLLGVEFPSSLHGCLIARSGPNRFHIKKTEYLFYVSWLPVLAGPLLAKIAIFIELVFQDGSEGYGIKAGAADQSAVDFLLGHERPGIVGLDAAAIQDAKLRGNLVAK